MTESLLHILQAENAALRAMDFPAATGLLERKQAALAALDASAPLAELREVAAENQRLLRQAIDTQGRVIALILRTAADAAPRPAGYNRAGRKRPQTVTPLAISARA